jgi:hypothetical protein
VSEGAHAPWYYKRIESRPGAEKKDALEQRVCSEICFTRDDGQLARYQDEFAKDWVVLYRQIMR